MEKKEKRKEKSEWKITANEDILFKYRINDKGELECREYKCEGEDAYGRITYLDTGITYTTKDYEIKEKSEWKSGIEYKKPYRECILGVMFNILSIIFATLYNKSFYLLSKRINCLWRVCIQNSCLREPYIKYHDSYI